MYSKQSELGISAAALTSPEEYTSLKNTHHGQARAYLLRGRESGFNSAGWRAARSPPAAKRSRRNLRASIGAMAATAKDSGRGCSCACVARFPACEGATDPSLIASADDANEASRDAAGARSF